MLVQNTKNRQHGHIGFTLLEGEYNDRSMTE